MSDVDNGDEKCPLPEVWDIYDYDNDSLLSLWSRLSALANGRGVEALKTAIAREMDERSLAYKLFSEIVPAPSVPAPHVEAKPSSSSVPVVGATIEVKPNDAIVSEERTANVSLQFNNKSGGTDVVVKGESSAASIAHKKSPQPSVSTKGYEWLAFCPPWYVAEAARSAREEGTEESILNDDAVGLGASALTEAAEGKELMYGQRKHGMWDSTSSSSGDESSYGGRKKGKKTKSGSGVTRQRKVGGGGGGAGKVTRMNSLGYFVAETSRKKNKRNTKTEKAAEKVPERKPAVPLRLVPASGAPGGAGKGPKAFGATATTKNNNNVTTTAIGGKSRTAGAAPSSSTIGKKIAAAKRVAAEADEGLKQPAPAKAMGVLTLTVSAINRCDDAGASTVTVNNGRDGGAASTASSPSRHADPEPTSSKGVERSEAESEPSGISLPPPHHHQSTTVLPTLLDAQSILQEQEEEKQQLCVAAIVSAQSTAAGTSSSSPLLIGVASAVAAAPSSSSVTSTPTVELARYVNGRIEMVRVPSTIGAAIGVGVGGKRHSSNTTAVGQLYGSVDPIRAKQTPYTVDIRAQRRELGDEERKEADTCTELARGSSVAPPESGGNGKGIDGLGSSLVSSMSLPSSEEDENSEEEPRCPSPDATKTQEEDMNGHHGVGGSFAKEKETERVRERSPSPQQPTPLGSSTQLSSKTASRLHTAIAALRSIDGEETGGSAGEHSTTTTLKRKGSSFTTRHGKGGLITLHNSSSASTNLTKPHVLADANAANTHAMATAAALAQSAVASLSSLREASVTMCAAANARRSARASSINTHRRGDGEEDDDDGAIKETNEEYVTMSTSSRGETKKSLTSVTLGGQSVSRLNRDLSKGTAATAGGTAKEGGGTVKKPTERANAATNKIKTTANNGRLAPTPTPKPNASSPTPSASTPTPTPSILAADMKYATPFLFPTFEDFLIEPFHLKSFSQLPTAVFIAALQRLERDLLQCRQECEEQHSDDDDDSGGSNASILHGSGNNNGALSSSFNGMLCKIQRTRTEVYSLVLGALVNPNRDGDGNDSNRNTDGDKRHASHRRWQEVDGPCWNLWWSWNRPLPRDAVWLAVQRANHIPRSKELTHKDKLKRNIFRYAKGRGQGAAAFRDLMPLTFVLPNEYLAFVEAFGEVGGSWIIKVLGLSRGRGITVINRIEKVAYSDPVIIQRYVDRPLLIDGGYKFDMRLYVVVTQFSPLECFVSSLGFARIAAVKYDPLTIDDKYAHITNTSVSREYSHAHRAHAHAGGGASSNEESEEDDDADDERLIDERSSKAEGNATRAAACQERAPPGERRAANSGQVLPQSTSTNTYASPPPAAASLPSNARKDTKWLLSKLAEYIERTQGTGTWARVWVNIKTAIIRTLACAEDNIPRNPCCFELFGFDVLLDENLRPWVLEVNASPAMDVEGPEDEAVKPRIIRETVDLLELPVVNRDALSRVVTARLHALTSRRQSQRFTSSDTEAHIREILGNGHIRSYGEMPSSLGSFERLAPSSEYDQTLRYKRTSV